MLNPIIPPFTIHFVFLIPWILFNMKLLWKQMQCHSITWMYGIYLKMKILLNKYISFWETYSYIQMCV